MLPRISLGAYFKYNDKTKRIHRRTIKHGHLQVRKAKRNRNCPKFILGYCWHLFQNEILALCEPEERQHLEESFRITREWIDNGTRDNLSLANLKTLFGTGNEIDDLRRYLSAKVFSQFLSQRALELVMQNRKLQNPVSYLICLQKLTARLPNAALMSKLQFK